MFTQPCNREMGYDRSKGGAIVVDKNTQRTTELVQEVEPTCTIEIVPTIV